MIARWDECAGLAMVEVNRGIQLDTMGKRGRVDTLFPEEMLFLVEKSRLALFKPYSNEFATIEEAYGLLEEQQISLESYLVYSALKCAGNVVFRPGIVPHEQSELMAGEKLVWMEVWRPQQSKKWTRKSAGPPSFYVVLSNYSESRSHQEQVEQLRDLAKLAKEKGVALKLASVSCGVVSFFTVGPPSLPRS